MISAEMQSRSQQIVFTFGVKMCMAPTSVIANPTFFNPRKHCFYNAYHMELRAIAANFLERGVFVAENNLYETSIRRININSKRDVRLVNGPGKVECKYLNVDSSLL